MTLPLIVMVPLEKLNVGLLSLLPFAVDVIVRSPEAVIEDKVEVNVVVYVVLFPPAEVVASPTLKDAHVTLPDPLRVPLAFV